jgi:hypothetical protein
MTSSEDFTQRNEGRRKTGVVRWIRRIALGLLMLLITLAVTGLVYQAVATRNDRQEFPPPGDPVAGRRSNRVPGQVLASYLLGPGYEVLTSSQG